MTFIAEEIAYQKELLEWLGIMEDAIKKIKEGMVTKPDIEEPDPTTEPEKPIEMGEVKPGGWGDFDPNPDNWDAVEMVKKGYEGLWKVIDKSKVIIAHKFSSKESAENFIDYMKENGTPSIEPTEPEKPSEPLPEGQIGPYPTTGKTKNSTTRGPTERHYASGKPDDWTIEKNVTGIPFKNYQFVVKTTIKKMVHDDNVSIKGLGKHMNSKGWYDAGVSIYEGQTCLGVEPKHPSTKLCIIKGDKIGDIRNKTVEIALVCFRDENYIELWTKLEGGEWKLNCKGANVGGLKPDMDENHECQERIDGFVKDSVPELHMAIVEELAPEVKPAEGI